MACINRYILNIYLRLRGDTLPKNKFSKLQINTDKMTNWISLWCENNLNGSFTISSNEDAFRIRYTITNNGKTILLDLIKASEGLHTIHYKIGTQQHLSEQLAQDIYKRVHDVMSASPFSKGFSVKISDEDSQLLIDSLKAEEEISLESFDEVTTPGVPNYRMYKFKGIKGDKAVIKYYPNTSRLQIQGKPLDVFNTAVGLISELNNDKDELVDAHIKYCDLHITKEEIYEELSAVLGVRLYSFLPLSHRAMISTAFNLCKVEFESDDYSYLLTNVCRTYEGYLKKVFAQKNLICEGEKQLGMFFEWETPSNPKMKLEYSVRLDEETEKMFTSMYKAYSLYRHPYMHASGYDVSTVIISDRDKAIDKFNEMIESLKAWHEWVYDNVL